MTARRTLLAAAALLTAPATLRAQSSSSGAAWPTRPVRVINPYSPGGTTDVVMRLMAERLERAFGQPWIIESRPGAGGSIGTAAVAAAAPDGYTFAITNTGPLAVAPTILPTATYRPDSFTYVVLFGGAPIVCAVRAASPQATIADYAAAARARPEAVSSGNTGAGSIGHLAALLFQGASGSRLLHVPFRGAPEAQAATIAGDIDSLWDTIGAHAGAVRGGSLRALAFTAAERVPLFPSVPTLREAGFADAVASNWFLLAGPANLPDGMAARINAVCQAAMAEPVVRERMDALGLVSLGDIAPDALRRFVGEELTRWAPIARAAG